MKILPIESILGLLESEEGAKFIKKLFKILSKEKRLNDEVELLNIINKVLNRLKEEGKIEEFVIKHTS